MPPEDARLPSKRRARAAYHEDSEDSEPRKRLRARARSPIPVATVSQGKKRRTTNKSTTIDQKISDALIKALGSLPTSSPSGPDPLLHRCTCDHCEWQDFSGIRFKCAVCEDYDLCAPCYNRNVHDVTHPFMEIRKPGGQPTYLPPRCNVSDSTTTRSSGKPGTPRRLQPSSARPATSSVIQFRKGDVVGLTGLKRAPDMNEMTAMVVSVDDSEQKALVRTETSGQMFRVKFSNLRMQDDSEAVEELE